MRITAISDQHFDLIEDEKFKFRTLEALAQVETDVLIVGGDVAKSKQVIKYVLDSLSGLDCLKLAYLGNHELQALEERGFGDHFLELGELFEESGFYLLDKSPVVYDDVGFVGNSGWFDFSLYRGQVDPKKIAQIIDYYDGIFRTNGKTIHEFTGNCVSRVRSHIRQIESGCDQIVLGIHFVAFADFLRYGHSELFDFKNFVMGSDRFQEFYSHPKVRVGLCGHTHRSGVLEFEGRKIYNISSDENTPFLQIDI